MLLELLKNTMCVCVCVHCESWLLHLFIYHSNFLFGLQPNLSEKRLSNERKINKPNRFDQQNVAEDNIHFLFVRQL